MSTTEAHTPTPWALSRNGFAIYSNDGAPILVAEIADHLNAAHIVHCVNSFDALTRERDELLVVKANIERTEEWLRQQRDALTEANKKMVAALELARSHIREHDDHVGDCALSQSDGDHSCTCDFGFTLTQIDDALKGAA